MAAVPRFNGFGLGLFLAALAMGSGEGALAEIRASGKNGLSTEVNGQRGGRCTKGVCRIGGGTKAGKNTFHRFKNFDTRGAIKRVKFDTGGQCNLFSWISLLSILQSSIDILILGYKIRIYINRQTFHDKCRIYLPSIFRRITKSIVVPGLQSLNTSTAEQSSHV